ncbi:hypothetical protein DBR32_01165 [Taibaiella sp. KBW10]|nr:T9SS type A sorting domain-containing protein [Taibaiella sp. KBW10]RQO32249.1 hypothetical protein DBR32_01165 [Taibaiella sp. KBW10]
MLRLLQEKPKWLKTDLFRLKSLRLKLFAGLMLLLCQSTESHAQTNISNYAFTKSTGTYTPITGGTAFVASGVAYDEDISAAINIPSFTFGGAAQTSLYISANGFITFGAAPAGTNYTPLSTLGSTTGAVAAYAADLGYTVGTVSAGASPEIRHQLVGTEYVIQFTDARRWGSTAERTSFQIRLNTANGEIKIVYGGPIVGGSSTSSIQVGLRGNSITYASNVNNLMTGNVPTATTCSWADAVTGYDNGSTMYLNTTNNSIAPIAGLTYTWTPAANPAPVRTFAAVTNLFATSAKINWTAPTGATEYEVAYRIPGTCAWTNFSGNPVSTNTATITGLLPVTTYQVMVRSKSGTNYSIWSHIPNQAGTGNGYTTTGTLTTTPTCMVPTNLINNTVTRVGATIRWSPPNQLPANGYDYYVSTTNTAPTASTTPTGTVATDTFKVITGLPPATLHYVWVRSNCSSTDKSAWTATTTTTSFTTLCATPAPGATLATPSTNLCAGATIALSFTNQTAGPVVSYAWQSSTDGITFTNIAGATANTLSTAAIDNYYRCRVICSGGPDTVYSTPVQINYINNVLTATGAQRCGAGTVALTATANSGATINWYAAITGGASLGTGSPFTTPPVAATSTFYAEASQITAGLLPIGAGASTGTGVAYNPTNGGYGGLKGQYLLTAAELQSAGLTAGNISSLALELTTAGATLNGFTIQMGPTALTSFAATDIQAVTTTVYPSASFVPTVGVNTFTLATPYNWDGTSNILISISWSNANSSNTSSTVKYDATTNYASLTYRKDNETAANMLAFTGPTGSGTNTFDRSQNRPKLILNGQVICRSPRVAATATINTAPAFDVTNNKTVCNTAITTLTVNSPATNYNNVTWSPVTNLFTDAAATVAYAANANASTVYYKNTTAGLNTYVATANNTTTQCGAVDTVKLQTLPATTTAIAATGTLCISGTSIINLTPAITQTGLSYQWQSSADNTTFADITTSGTGATYTTPSITATQYYRATIKNSDGIVCFNSVSDTVLVNNPQVATTAPGTRCGIGPVILGATPSTGATINWYTAATGGTPVGTGNSFTTPSISATTNYFAEPSIGSSPVNVGPVNNATTLSYFVTPNWGITFDCTAPTVIQSVAVYPGSAGTMTIAVQNSMTSPTVFGTYTATFTAAQIGTRVVLPINITVPTAGTGYKMIVQSSTGLSGLHRETPPGGGFPYTTAGCPISLTNSEWGGTTTGTFYFFYDWVIGQSCKGPRVSVAATVTPAPTFDVTNDKTVCNNGITTLTVNSPAANFNTVTWSPITNLYTNAAATTAYVANANASTVYYKNTTAGTVMYTANALNTTTQCANLDTVKIQTLPATTTAVALVGTLCQTGSSTLSLVPAITQTGFTYQWQNSANNVAFTDITTAGTSATYTTPTITTTQYYRATIKNSDGAACFNSVSDTVVVNNPLLLTTTPGERCGPGTVILNATANAGAAPVWYSALTGGTALGTGTNFTTPALTATTNYYVAAEINSPVTGTVGTGAATSTTYPNPFYSLWSNTHNQYLITAAELQAAGLMAGNINSLAIKINSGTMTMQDFSLKMAHTTATNMSAFVAPTFTPVYAATSLTPVVGVNTINFSTPFNWNGTSNIVIEVCHGNSASSTTMSSSADVDNTAYVSTIHVHKSTSSAGSATCTDILTNLTTYSIRPKFTFSGTTSCASTPRVMVTATVKVKPTATLTPNGTINLCQGAAQTLTGAGTGNYSWLKNNAVIPGQTTNTYSANQTGAYKIVVTNTVGCSDTSVAANVTVNPKPVVNLGNDTAVCGNVTLTLNAGNPGAAYLWNDNSTNSTLAAVNAGQYRVKVTNTFNCATSDTINIAHLAVPVVNLGNDTMICHVQPLILNAQNPGSTYVWSTGASTQTISVNQAGTYSVNVTNTSNCTGNDAIIVTSMPDPINDGFNFVPLFNEAQGKVRFEPIDANNTYTYAWNFGDGGTSTQMTPTHVYAAAGDYLVSMDISNGCTDTTVTLPIRVDFTLGTVTVSKNNINMKLYPNPAQDQLNLELIGDHIFFRNIIVYNVIGQKVLDQKTNKTTAEKISTQQLPAGMYILKAETDKGMVMRKFEIIK